MATAPSQVRSCPSPVLTIQHLGEPSELLHLGDRHAAIRQRLGAATGGHQLIAQLSKALRQAWRSAWSSSVAIHRDLGSRGAAVEQYISTAKPGRSRHPQGPWARRTSSGFCSCRHGQQPSIGAGTAQGADISGICTSSSPPVAMGHAAAEAQSSPGSLCTMQPAWPMSERPTAPGRAWPGLSCLIRIQGRGPWQLRAAIEGTGTVGRWCVQGGPVGMGAAAYKNPKTMATTPVPASLLTRAGDRAEAADHAGAARVAGGVARKGAHSPASQKMILFRSMRSVRLRIGITGRRRKAPPPAYGTILRQVTLYCSQWQAHGARILRQTITLQPRNVPRRVPVREPTKTLAGCSQRRTPERSKECERAGW
jgi:hypothetical protein